MTYGTYATEDEAAMAQARWRLTGLLPADDPQVEVPAGGRGRGCALRGVVRALAGGQASV